MFLLKHYQQTTLDQLQAFLEDARFDGAEAAFGKHTSPNAKGLPRRYIAVDDLPNTPYICLRLPTGGGKTHLSVHAIKIAAQAYLEQDFPFVLLLVPTNAIRTQTLATLKNPNHPNRQVLDQAFNGRVLIHDIGDFTQIRPQDIRDKCVIVISTMAALRVDKTEGRKLYAHNEHLEPHFARVPVDSAGLERLDNGEIKYSFRNLLALLQPLLLVDEAHNAKSNLSFKLMQRIAPACIVEFTATPAKNSNVLHSVSAAELKAEEMIKLPIMLTEHPTWQMAVRDAIAARQRLHDLAQNDPDFIQPIVLFQAENKDKEVTTAVLEKFLVEEEKIARTRIAIATGKQKELEGINLLDPSNQVQFVITVQALKEGWDCPFAYIFCSVAKVYSPTAVEQLLGRVLRMPYAKKRSQAELNRAYAHVARASWPQAVGKLYDRLVSMGFNKAEAQTFIEAQPPLLEDIGDQQQPSLWQRMTLTLQEAPDLSSLTTDEQAQVEEAVVPETGVVVVTVSGTISTQLGEKLIKAVPRRDRSAVKQNVMLYRHKQNQTRSPAQKGTPFVVPQLSLWADDMWELVEEEWYLDADGWNLLDYPATLSEYEFSIQESADSYLIDIKGQKLMTSYVDTRQQFDLGEASSYWTLNQLSRRLDRKLYQPDITQQQLLEFIRRTLTHLVHERQIALSTLVRHRYPLIKALKEKIKTYRDQAHRAGYQKMLVSANRPVETNYEYAFAFDLHNYPTSKPYAGPYQFNKHFYQQVDDLRHEGEEFLCAQAIDRSLAVSHWVRNLVNPDFGLRLPLANGYFYPDFVAQLHDGRILIVEYKGDHIKDSVDSKEKDNIGQLWEAKSGGKGLFLLALKKDKQGRDIYAQLESKIS